MYKDVVKTTNIVKPLGRDIIRHTYIVNSLGIDIMRHNKIQKNKHVIGRIQMSASAANRTGPRKTPDSDPRDTPQQAREAPDPAQHPRTVTCGKFGSSKPVRSHRAQPKSPAPRERRHVGHHKKTRTHGLAKSDHRQNSCDTYTLKVHDLHKPYMVYRTYKSHAI